MTTDAGEREALTGMLALLEEKGTPVGKFRSRLYGVLLSDVGKALPLRTQAIVLLGLGAEIAMASAMRLGEALSVITAVQRDMQERAQLPPPAAPEPGSEERS